jgi:hypothetical protein
MAQTQHCRPHRFLPRAGQAMIELVVAMIAILVVITGLLQLILLGTADSNTMVAATAEAAARATAGVAMLPTLDIVADWEAGPDGMDQTKDDVRIGGSLARVQQHIAGATAPNDDWSAVDGARNNDIATLHHGALPSTTFGLVRGQASESAEVIPAAVAFFGLSDPAEVKNEVWMTATGALY